MIEILKIIENEQPVYGIISNKRSAAEKYNKITFKPYLSGSTLMYQTELFTDKQAEHINSDKDGLIELIKERLLCYKSFDLFTTDHDYRILIGKKGNVNIKKTAPTKALDLTPHNRAKNYIYRDGVPCEFLTALGIMTADGKVKAQKYNKFVQINKYLEIISGSLKLIKPKDKLKIVDFGCGKAYLTFALYAYLTERLGIEAEITGVDLKDSVISECSALADRLGFDGLSFVSGDIRDFANESVDAAVSLHACDTATDEAIIKAVSWGCKLIIAVPCCHHELFNQVQNDILEPILRYGVLKDKLASLITDSMRGLALEAAGYDVNIMELTPEDNTPKNVLIRAVKTDNKNTAALKKYEAIKEQFHVCPYIDRLEVKYEKM